MNLQKNNNKKRKFDSKMFLFQASSLRVRERGVKQRKIKNIIQNNSRQNNNNKKKINRILQNETIGLSSFTSIIELSCAAIKKKENCIL